MAWQERFYSATGAWWGPAESAVGDGDFARLAILQRLCPDARRVLELGCGYGSTAVACADAGLDVVGIDLSDRVDFCPPRQGGGGDHLRLVRGDFYRADVGGDYDVVAYWNGFGVGTDAEQRALLRRVAHEWLAPTGKALIDVGNPFVRASYAGEREHRDARPDVGYGYDVEEHTDYDPVHNRFIDTWWERGKHEERLTQTLRCYAPADLLLLLEGTGLKLLTILVDGKEHDLAADHTGDESLLTAAQEYLAVLSAT